MLFNPASLISDWPLILATLGIVLIGKPLAAFIVVKLFGKPLRMALSVQSHWRRSANFPSSSPRWA